MAKRRGCRVSGIESNRSAAESKCAIVARGSMRPAYAGLTHHTSTPRRAPRNEARCRGGVLALSEAPRSGAESKWTAAGVAPAFQVCRTCVLLLDDAPMVPASGVAPLSAPYERAGLLLTYAGELRIRQSRAGEVRPALPLTGRMHRGQCLRGGLEIHAPGWWRYGGRDAPSAWQAGGGCCPRTSPLPRAQTVLLSYAGDGNELRGPDPFICQ